MTQNAEGVFPIANTDDKSRVADIVFIHGLGGKSHDTWRYGKEGKPGHFFWPEEFGKDLKNCGMNCGVWTVGYAAGITELGDPGMILEMRAGSIALKLANAGLGDRPIIFITHSMGGLVVKYLVVRSQTSPDLDRKRIAGWIRGIVFCATPHRGAALANAAGILGAFFGGSQAHVKEMKANAEPLDLMHEEFIEWHRRHPTPIESYAEHIGLFKKRWFFRPLPLGLVVERASANPGIVGHAVRDVAEDHLTIVKPKDSLQDVYAGVKRFIMRVLAKETDAGDKVETDILCLIDRESPLAEIKMKTKETPGNHLLTVFVDGHDSQRPQYFVSRLEAEKAFAHHWHDKHSDFIEIPWPEHRGTAEAYAQLMETLRFKLHIEDKITPNVIRSTLKQADSVHVFVSYLYEDHFNIDLLERWVKFWHDEVAIYDDPSPSSEPKPKLTIPVVLVFCCIYDSIEKPAFEQSDKNSNDMRHLVRKDLLPVRLISQNPTALSNELQDVRVPLDIVAWLEILLKNRPERKKKIRDPIGFAEKIFGDADSNKMPMKRVLSKLHEVI